MNKRDLKKFERILSLMKEEVASEVSHIQKDHLHRNLRAESGNLSGYSTHMADMAGDEEELTMTLRMLAAEEDILTELDEALKRIEEGTYGECERCKKTIGKARLTALPFARHCIECKTKVETGR